MASSYLSAKTGPDAKSTAADTVISLSVRCLTSFVFIGLCGPLQGIIIVLLIWSIVNLANAFSSIKNKELSIKARGLNSPFFILELQITDHAQETGQDADSDTD